MPIDIRSYAGPFPVEGVYDGEFTLDETAVPPDSVLVSAQRIRPLTDGIDLSEIEAALEALLWQPASTSPVLDAGNYAITAANLPDTATLNIKDGQVVRVKDMGEDLSSVNTFSIGDGTYSFRLAGVVNSGPFVMNSAGDDFSFVASDVANGLYDVINNKTVSEDAWETLTAGQTVGAGEYRVLGSALPDTITLDIADNQVVRIKDFNNELSAATALSVGTVSYNFRYDGSTTPGPYVMQDPGVDYSFVATDVANNLYDVLITAKDRPVTEWSTLTAGQTVASGAYRVLGSALPDTITLSIADNQVVRVKDFNAELSAVNSLSIGSNSDNFRYEGATTAGPYVLQDPNADYSFVGTDVANGLYDVLITAKDRPVIEWETLTAGQAVTSGAYRVAGTALPDTVTLDMEDNQTVRIKDFNNELSAVNTLSVGTGTDNFRYDGATVSGPYVLQSPGADYSFVATDVANDLYDVIITNQEVTEVEWETLTVGQATTLGAYRVLGTALPDTITLDIEDDQVVRIKDFNNELSAVNTLSIGTGTDNFRYNGSTVAGPYVMQDPGADYSFVGTDVANNLYDVLITFRPVTEVSWANLTASQAVTAGAYRVLGTALPDTVTLDILDDQVVRIKDFNNELSDVNTLSVGTASDSFRYDGVTMPGPYVMQDPGADYSFVGLDVASDVYDVLITFQDRPGITEFEWQALPASGTLALGNYRVDEDNLSSTVDLGQAEGETVRIVDVDSVLTSLLTVTVGDATYNFNSQGNTSAGPWSITRASSDLSFILRDPATNLYDVVSAQSIDPLEALVWTNLTANQTLTAGNYRQDGSLFANNVLLGASDGDTVRIKDFDYELSSLPAFTLQVGDATNTFNYKGTITTGPYEMTEAGSDFSFIATDALNGEYDVIRQVIPVPANEITPYAIILLEGTEIFTSGPITCTYNSTGLYTVTFDPARPTVDYYVNADVHERNDDRVTIINGSETTTEFRFEVKNQGSIAARSNHRASLIIYCSEQFQAG